MRVWELGVEGSGFGFRVRDSGFGALGWGLGRGRSSKSLRDLHGYEQTGKVPSYQQRSFKAIGTWEVCVLSRRRDMSPTRGTPNPCKP